MWCFFVPVLDCVGECENYTEVVLIDVFHGFKNSYDIGFLLIAWSHLSLKCNEYKSKFFTAVLFGVCFENFCPFNIWHVWIIHSRGVNKCNIKTVLAEACFFISLSASSFIITCDKYFFCWAWTNEISKRALSNSHWSKYKDTLITFLRLLLFLIGVLLINRLFSLTLQLSTLIAHWIEFFQVIVILFKRGSVVPILYFLNFSHDVGVWFES